MTPTDIVRPNVVSRVFARVLTLLALLLVAGQVSAQTGSITGTVTSAASSLPLGGVYVSVYNGSNSFVNSALTDSLGVYTVGGLPAGTYYLRTSVPNEYNYINQVYSGIACPTTCTVTTGTPVTVSAGGATSGINFALAGGGTLAGVVTDASTLAGIGSLQLNAYTSTGAYIRYAYTAADGTYQITGLPTGSYFVRTFASSTQNYVDELYNDITCSPSCTVTSGTTVPVTAGATTSNINMALAQGGSVSGTVTNAATLAPITGGEVDVYNSSGSLLRSGVLNGTGGYSVVGLPSGSYFVRTFVYYGQNYVDEQFDNIPCPCTTPSGTAVPVTLGANTPNINFALAVGGTISGTVADASTLAPLANIQVNIYTPAGVVARYATSNAGGVFSATGLAAGTYYAKTSAYNSPSLVNELYNGITCYGSCTVTTGTPIVVTAGATTPNINFTLETGGTVTGRVSDQATDASLASVNVSIYSSTGQSLQGALTTAGGIYTFTGVPSGTYYLRTFASGGYLNEIYNNLPCPVGCTVTLGTPVTVSAGTTTGNIDFALSTAATITGLVRDASTLAGIGSVSVQVYTNTLAFVTSGTTNGSGAYSLTGLFPGTYFLRTSVSSSSPYINELYGGALCGSSCLVTSGVPVTITAGTTTPNIDFDLAAGGNITGTVTDGGTASPIGTMSVLAFTSTGNLARGTSTNASGVYTIAGLPNGTYYVRTSSSGTYLDEVYNNIPCTYSGCVIASGQPLTVAAGGTLSGVDFALASGGAISGSVTDAATGLPISSVSVSAYSLAGASVRSGSTDAGGTFTISGLPAGSYFLRTSVPASLNYVDEMYDNIPCIFSCNVVTSTPVAVTVGSATSGIAFALSGGGTISGSVKDSVTQAPLSAFITLSNQAGGSRQSQAVNGLFSFTGLAPGSYYLRTAAGSGYVNEQYDNIPCVVCNAGGTPVVVTAGTVATGVNFLLDPAVASGGGISGVVTDAATSAPLGSVLVSAVTSAGSSFGISTSATGAYVLTGLPAGNYFVRTSVNSGVDYIDEVYNDIACAGCDARIGAPVTVSSSAITLGIDLALAKGGSIAGVVTDASTLAPVAGVSLQLSNAQGAFVRSVTSGLEGGFIFTGLPSGNYFVRTLFSSSTPYVDQAYNGVVCIPACSSMSGTPIVVTAGATTSGVNFALIGGGAIAGTVTGDGSAVGIPGVFVGVYVASGASVRSGTTSADGAFTIVGLAPGTYYVRTSVSTAHNYIDEVFSDVTCFPSCSGTMATGTPVVVSSGSTAAVNFALTPGGSISGLVRNASTLAGIEGATVRIYTSTGANPRSAVTNANGNYVVKGLPSGSYYVRVSVPAGLGYGDQLYNGMPCAACDARLGTAVPVTVGAVTGNVDFNLAPGGTITGRVTDAATGLGVGPVTVQVYDALGRFVRALQTFSNGDYVVTGLAAGSYRAKVLPTAYIDQVYNGATCLGSCSAADGTPIPVTAGQTTPNVNFSLTAGGSISGTVVAEATGLGLNALVAVYNAQGTAVRTTSTSGVYTVSGLAPGTYYVATISASSGLSYADEVYNNTTCTSCDVTLGMPVAVTAGANTPNINFALAQGGAFSGTVKDASTLAGLYGITVNVYASNGTGFTSVSTDALGAYAVSGLAPGTYYARTNLEATSPYVDELFSETACAGCNPVLGSPIVVTAGNTTPNVDFTLETVGGGITGVVRVAGTNAPLATIPVTVYSSNGAVVRRGTADVNGVYSVAGLPAGTYYARTDATRGYVNRVYNDAGVPCVSDCDVLAGAAIVVADGLTTNGIDFSLPVNLARNTAFGSGTANWSLFATPSTSYLTSAVVNEVFEFTRVAPPPGTSNQAVIFQTTGTAEPTGTPLVAAFDLGNSSTVRKRVSVLIIDSNFSDLSVCTFWIPPSQPLKTYRMKTHTTKAWTNASIYFYAATAGTDGGSYRLDNVAFYADSAEPATSTTCEDPNAGALPGGVTSSTMLQNGDFGSGTLSPGWGTFGTITTQVSGGVLEFIRPTNVAPSGVVLQATNQALSSGQVLTAGFSLGNSSGVRKRVTVLLHDNNFSDLSACTFWLPPGQPLAGYSMKTYTTKAWTNATLSVYPATTGADQWIRLDDVSLVRDAVSAIAGTDCVEPSVSRPAVLSTAAGALGLPSLGVGNTADSGHRDVVGDARRGASGAAVSGTSASSFVVDGDWHPRADGSTVATAGDSSDAVLRLRESIDLRNADAASLEFLSRLAGGESTGDVQVHAGDGEWVSVASVTAGALEWRRVDLSAFAGEVIDVRFVFHAVAGEPADTWEVSDVRVVR